MKKIIKYVIIDILRNRIVIGYTLLLLVISFSVFSLEDNPSRGILSLVNLVLIIVPLVSIIFSTIYVYNASEFIELLVSHPLKRNRIWISMFLGLAVSLSLALLIGIGLPVLIYTPNSTGIILLVSGLALSLTFIAVAMLASALTRDKAKGIGISILLWFFFSIIYDGIILFLLFQFSEYPMETPMIFFTSLNPVDLARILILLKLDISALMGYTGALFQEFFGTSKGMLFSFTVLLIWAFIPLWLSIRRFNRKDL